MPSLGRCQVLLFVLSLPVRALAAQATSSPLTTIPIKSVMLFSSGVGYFEHDGTVHGDGSAELRFKTDQINDILKSLVLQDLDGGRVTTVTYPSQDPVAKTLRSFQVDITSNPSMASLLTQLRGAHVTLQALAERLSGTILGVEFRSKAGEKGDPVSTPVVNILTGAMIRSVDLPSVTSLTLDDPQLQEELTRALAALSQSRDQDRKPVTITFLGNGERRVRIGYLVQTPIWKTSYRLMLDDKGARLQGWAIVENQTESDWNNVSLSLVSGRPISFTMDLYQPLYLQRPNVVPELFAGLRPQVYSGGISVAGGRIDPSATYINGAPVQLNELTVTAGRNALVARDAVTTKQFEEASVTTGGSSAAFGNAQAGIMNIARPVQSMARAAQLGALFQYAIPNVTLARQKSAMLPIVTDSVGVERLSIYNAGVLPSNPLNGVRLHNTTGKHLLEGPITVLDKNAYAGDAQIDNVPPGQERLLSYGIDLETLVDNSQYIESATVASAHIAKGALLIERKLVSSRVYRIDNKGAHDKTILIEHPIRNGWTLAAGLKPVESTPSLYRFQLSAPAGRVTELPVREEMVQRQSIMMVPGNVTGLLQYYRNGEIPADVRDAVAKATKLKEGVSDLERQIVDRTSQVEAITNEQERIRDNMKTVDAKSQYYDRLLTKLNDQESAIERLQKERDDLQARRDVQQKALVDYLDNLTVG
jgi:cytochrome c556